MTVVQGLVVDERTVGLVVEVVVMDIKGLVGVSGIGGPRSRVRGVELSVVGLFACFFIVYIKPKT